MYRINALEVSTISGRYYMVYHKSGTSKFDTIDAIYIHIGQYLKSFLSKQYLKS